jgi:dienelactone hydrolase
LNIESKLKEIKMSLVKSPKSGLFFMLLFFQVNFLFGQEENLNVLERWISWSDGKNMLVHHLNKQAFAHLTERDKEIAGLTNQEDWLERQKNLKSKLIHTVGPFPEKTPLNAKIMGVVAKEGYQIEKIMYESMPGFYVTGSLFKPEGLVGKNPAILFVSGHTPLSYLFPAYQSMILNLVNKGFIVFAIDCIGQGERIQHYDPEKEGSVITGSTTREHSYLGNQTLLAGVSLARYFTWDGIRGIDYLLSRDDIDPARLGVTGQSGGGAQASYIFAFDERIKAGAPINYITGFRRLLESIGPQDAEQNFYRGIINGITHADLLEVRAPNPALIGAGTRDFFSIQGARETYEEVRNAYKAYGKDENIQLVEDDFAHGYTRKLREATNAFFQKNLNLPGEPEDEEIEDFDPNEIRVTETGQVASSFENAETVYSINKKESQILINKIQESRKNIEPHLKALQTKAKEISGYIEPQEEVKSIFRGRYQREGYSVEMHALHGEGEYIIPLLLFIPNSGSKFSSVIYLNPKGKITDASPGGEIENLVKKGYIVAAPDVLGIGETAGSGRVAMLIGRSVVGIQAGDVVRVAKFLKTRSEVNSEKIAGLAIDEMGPTLLHAAAFYPAIQSISLVGSPISWSSMVMNKFYDPVFFGNAVAGALTGYDLPDLIGAISPRKVILVDLKDQMKNSASKELRDKELSFPRRVYSHKNVSENLEILTSTKELDFLVDWCLE